MSLIKQAEQAFLRTRPHPADETVRLVERPEDLVVVNMPYIKAAQWEREMPRDIAGILERMDEALQQPFSGAGCRDPLRILDRVRDEEEEVEPFVRDMRRLENIFMQAAGEEARTFDGEASIFYAGDQPFAPLRADQRPHKDTGYRLRMVSVYTSVPECGTEWYPHDLSWDDIGTFNEGLTQRQEHPGAIAAIKREYGRQAVTAGHVLIFKGVAGKNMREEQLVHNGQQGKAGFYRECFTLGT